MDDRLYKSTTDRSLSGVCGGIAAWMGLDPSLVRIGWVLLSLMSGGIFVVLYIVMAIVVPDAPPGWAPRGRPQMPGGAPGGGWGAPQPGTPMWGADAGAGAPTGGGAPSGSWGANAGNWGGNAPGGAWTGAPASTPSGAPSAAPTGAPTRPRGDWEARHGGDQAGIVAGVVLVVLGVWFLVRDYVPINWDLVWPVAVIALGALLIVGALRRSR